MDNPLHTSLLAISLALATAVPSACAGGVLRVHPDNPRYFSDGTEKAIYLAGHQWFNDLQHHAWNHPVNGIGVAISSS